MPGGVYDDSVQDGEDEHDPTLTVTITDEGEVVIPGFPPLIQGGFRDSLDYRNLAGCAWICEEIFMYGVNDTCNQYTNKRGEWSGYACQKGGHDWVSVGSFTSFFGDVGGDSAEDGFVIANCTIKGTPFVLVSHAMSWDEPPSDPEDEYPWRNGWDTKKELRWMGVPATAIYDTVVLGYESPKWIDVTNFVGTKLRGSAVCVRFTLDAAQEARRSKPCVRCLGGDDEGLVLVCESCDDAYHATCVGFGAPLEGNWLCGPCGAG
eukprot:2477008-Prymnesium_polylepis.1